MAGPGGVEVDRVSVRVVPNTASFPDDLRVELARIEREVTMSIRASVDTTRLIEDTRVAVDEAQASAGVIDVKAKVDTSQLSELDTALSGIRASSAASATSLLSMSSAGALLSTALIPVTAAVLGLGAAIGSVAAAGTAGLGIFGVISAAAIAKATTDAKQITTLQQKIATSTGAAHAQYVAQLKTLESGIPAAEMGLINSFNGIKVAFSNLLKQVGSSVFTPLTQGINLVAHTMPLLTPVIKAFGKVASDMLTQIGTATKSPLFKQFIGFIATTGAQAFKTFAELVGNVAVGIGGFIEAFAPLGQSIMTSLLNASKAFAQLGLSAKKSPQIQAFLEYVRVNGPKVGDVLGFIFDGLAQAIKGLAPVGSLVLGVLDSLTKALGGMKGVAGPLVAIMAGLLIPFGGPEVAAVLGLATAFGELYTNSKQFRGIVHDIAQPLRQLTTQLGGFLSGLIANAPALFASFNKAIGPIKTAFGGVVGAVQGLATTLAPIVAQIAAVFVQNWPQIQQVATQVFRTVRTIVVTVLDVIDAQIKTITAVVGFVWKHFGDIILGTIQQVFPAVLKIISGALNIIQGLFAAFDDLLHGRWSKLWSDLGQIVKGALQILAGIVKVGLSIGAGVLAAALRLGKDIVGGIIQGIKNAASGIGDALKKEAQNALGAVQKFLRIGSPSKLFADEVGAHIASGIALGIDNNGHLVRSSLNKAVAPPQLSNPSQAGGVAGAGGGPMVNIEHMEAHDYRDFLKQSHQRRVAAGGGGVVFA